MRVASAPDLYTGARLRFPSSSRYRNSRSEAHSHAFSLPFLMNALIDACVLSPDAALPPAIPFALSTPSCLPAPALMLLFVNRAAMASRGLFIA
ncbi:hypothetical protein EVG20_g10697 [Dentipellis fragilis]|uniref:Uncharacterized protein n=1 Tax=Dentipellis fragilis TaxID=205917 RepID=A0A4Y9XPQ8_9AGAM|nr:hypothetical protein EVG20_g10697 [Dentipellis fragilis]